MTLSLVDVASILPALIVLVAGLLAVAADLFLTRENSRLPLSLISLTGLGAAVVPLFLRLWNQLPASVGFGGSVVLDGVAAISSLAICAAAALLIVLSAPDIQRRRINFGEYYGLVLLGTAGMMLFVSSNDLLMLFLNVEILSICMYVLTGLTRQNPRSNEAAIKYLVTGAFATGFLLMGMAFLYGATGEIQLPKLGEALSASASPLVPLGAGLLLVGMCFKLGAVPFHMWVPDVYEGAPTSITAFMSVAVKAAGLGALVRILLVGFGDRADLWADVLWGIALLTMIVGNVLAVQQRSVKRMLAYSSIAHTGYALVALATMKSLYGSFSDQGASAVLFYGVVYTFMTLGAFAMLIYLGHEVQVPGRDKPEWQDAEDIDDLAGLGDKRPWSALCMTVFLVSLAGIPPTAGFFGKFYLFKAAIDQGHYGLAVLGVMASLVSLFYYLRIVVAMYMQPAVADDEKPNGAVGAVIGIAMVATILLGLQPGIFIDWATSSVVALRGGTAPEVVPASVEEGH